MAGITRPTSFARGSEDDWRSVLAVHLDGYLNVLRRGAAASWPRPATGTILGVTSGSGWRAADTGAYGCAKRAVASLTWQLGGPAPRRGRRQRHVAHRRDPHGDRRPRRRQRRRGRPPRAGSRLVGHRRPLAGRRCRRPRSSGRSAPTWSASDFSCCRGQVIFAGGSEVAVVDQPRLLEVVRTDRRRLAWPACSRRSPAAVLAPAEAHQASAGGSNPRFGAVFDGSATVTLPSDRGAVVPRGHRPAGGGGLRSRPPSPPAGVTVPRSGRTPSLGFDGAAAALAAAVERDGAARRRRRRPGRVPGRGRHGDRLGAGAGRARRASSTSIHADAGWARAVADHVGAGRTRPSAW